MLMHTREGTTIVTQQQMNNLFRRLCSVRSFPLSRKPSLLICDGQFSFSHRTSKVEPIQLLLDTFSKSSTLSWKNWQQTASWSFSWSFSPSTIDFQNSPSFDFYMTRDLSWLHRSPTSSRPKKLASLAKKIVKLDSAAVSMVFQELCHLLAIFLDCSSSPYRSLLI